MLSHPVWVRGLKQVTCADGQTRFVVAPRVGAWIETVLGKVTAKVGFSRTPCGCVD